MSTLHIQPNNDPSLYNNYASQFSNNEIDLLNLIGILWHGKKLIISTVLIFAITGFFIAVLLPQKWTSRAEITPAEKIQWAELQKTLTALDVLEVKSTIKRDDVFNLFLKKFNSQSLREEFLKNSPLVTGKLQAANTDPEELRRGIVLLAQKMTAVNNATAKNSGESPYQSWTLSFSAPTASEAQEILNSYIDYVSGLVVQETLDTLRSEVELKKAFEKDSLAMERQRMKTLHETTIQKLNYSLEVANAAGIKRPVYSNGQAVQDDPDYSITLGADGIAEKLKIEKSIADVTRLNAQFLNREYRLAELEKWNVADVKFTPFKYQLSPALPTKKDGPGKALILVLSVLIGGLIACTLVLTRHALKQRKLV